MRAPSWSGSSKSLKALEACSEWLSHLLFDHRSSRFQPLERSDLALAIALWGDPRVSPFIGGPFTAEEVKARLRREIEMLDACKVQYWPVFLLKDGELAGCAGLRPYGDDEHIMELGFHFRPEYWVSALLTKQHGL